MRRYATDHIESNGPPVGMGGQDVRPRARGRGLVAREHQRRMLLGRSYFPPLMGAVMGRFRGGIVARRDEGQMQARVICLTIEEAI